MKAAVDQPTLTIIKTEKADGECWRRSPFSRCFGWVCELVSECASECVN